MLTDLTVEGLGVIDGARLTLEEGCTALTGETGAGKTLLVAALSLLLGSRSDRTLVRSGAPAAQVEARFEVPRDHPAARFLVAHGVLDGLEEADSAAELVLARTVTPDGRSRARANGRLVTAALLGEAGGRLVEIAGQQEHGLLSEPAQQRALLDSFAGREAVELGVVVAEEVRSAGRSRRAAEAAHGDERGRRRELDVLRYEIAEIEAAGVTPGEAEELAKVAERLENAEAIAEAIHDALAALKGEGAAGDLLSHAGARVGALVGADKDLADIETRLGSLAVEVEDIAGDLTRRSVTPDPAALERVRERLGVLQRLRRKYGDDEAGVLGYLDRSRARAAELEAGDEEADRHERDAEEHTERAAEAAEKLSQLRAEAAPRLAAAAQELLTELALEGARMEIGLEPRDLYEGGTENVEFRVATDPGGPPRPVARIASGGELSRIALALRVLTTTGSVRTMAFDEVDVGIGGAAAQSVGRLLARLARDSGIQVLVVTHLPQVAAFADAHFRVVRTERSGRVDALVERVEGEQRVAELSRMLAGLPESLRAQEHAQELLELAEGASK
jgi:DNA repair protein RecN (Recombination protein N)